jgi:RHS repeat-associated protein
MKYNFNLGAGNNGNVAGITNNRDGTRSQAFAYDALNRILVGETTSTHATSPTNCWGETYVYDNQTTGGAWGNLTNINVASSAYNGCTQEGLSVAAASNNQISGFCYDAAGNLLAQSAPPCPAPTYSYNTENQLTNANGTSYVYDGDGRRVEKVVGGAVTKIYWYGMNSDALDETDGSGNLANEYVFFGGKRIARRDSSGHVFYYFADHLGTSRSIVQGGQTTACYEADFYPFGGERPPIVNTCAQNYKFTGKERDSESGLDDFGARYYGSNIGQFMSPDPGDFHLENPQSLNHYAYALNSPLFYIDLDGADSISAVYRLGTASENIFVPSGQTFDTASLLASVSGGFDHLPLRDLQNAQPMATPRELNVGGGCVLGCVSTFNEVPVGLLLSLSFSYDDKTGQITGANIQEERDPNAAFIGPDRPSQRAAFQPLPGMTPEPQVFRVNIDSSVLRKLTRAQLAALDKATAGKRDAISQAVQKAIAAEEQRRSEEQRKKQEEEQKRECQKDGGNCG